LIPHQSMATGLSIESQARTLVTAAIAPVIGWLADRYGVGAALGIIAAVGLLLLPLLALRRPNQEI
jgi:MFS-type transporter involved in bile tolerance (Atg22 family)